MQKVFPAFPPLPVEEAKSFAVKLKKRLQEIFSLKSFSCYFGTGRVGRDRSSMTRRAGKKWVKCQPMGNAKKTLLTFCNTFLSPW